MVKFRQECTDMIRAANEALPSDGEGDGGETFDHESSSSLGEYILHGRMLENDRKESGSSAEEEQDSESDDDGQDDHDEHGAVEMDKCK